MTYLRNFFLFCFLQINLKKFWTEHLCMSPYFVFFFDFIFFNVRWHANEVEFYSGKNLLFSFLLEYPTLNIRKRTMVYPFEKSFYHKNQFKNKVRNRHTLFIPILTYLFHFTFSHTYSHSKAPLIYIFVYIYVQRSAECSIKYSFDIFFFQTGNFWEG